jgi:hypothetical protein
MLDLDSEEATKMTSEMPIKGNGRPANIHIISKFFNLEIYEIQYGRSSYQTL